MQRAQIAPGIGVPSLSLGLPANGPDLGSRAALPGAFSFRRDAEPLSQTHAGQEVP